MMRKILMFLCMLAIGVVLGRQFVLFMDNTIKKRELTEKRYQEIDSNYNNLVANETNTELYTVQNTEFLEDSVGKETDTDTEEIDTEISVASIYVEDMNLNDYRKLNVSMASASSTINQSGHDNSAYMLLDDDETSSWQEGVDGDGLGESVVFTLKEKKSLKYITFKLGNWRNEDYYRENNTPAVITLVLDNGKSFQINFPYEKREFCLEFKPECTVGKVTFIIDEVYKGTEYADTCIAEIGLFGS